MKLGIFLKSEQVREIVFQTVVRGTDLLVGIVPVLPVALGSLLLQEIFPPFEPFIQELFETFLIHERERLSDRQEFLPRFELRFQREIPSQDRFLMEVTHLDGNVRKDLSHAPSAIKDDSPEDEANLLQLFSRFPVHRRIFSADESPEDILPELRRPEYEHAVTAREERDIGGEDERLRVDMILFRNNTIQTFLDPWNTPSVLFRKLRERLLVPDVLFPKIQMSMLRPPFPLKLETAVYAFISLNTPSSSVPYDCRSIAFMALFLYVIANVLLVTAPVCHGMIVLTSQIFN